MPSPFPGMDPYIETQKWEDFYTRFISALGDAIVASVRPKYVVDVERRVYLETKDIQTPYQSFVADAVVLTRQTIPRMQSDSAQPVAVLEANHVEPTRCTIPFPDEHRETFITIRHATTRNVVTIIELLSPTNKRPGTDGHQTYNDKLTELLKTGVHVIELDLLRGGKRTVIGGRPEGDYFALVSRVKSRPMAEIYGWWLKQPMPPIPIPLAGDDPDVRLDLQAVFNTVYDRAGYDYSLDYHQPLKPDVSDDQADWLTQRLASLKP